MAKTTSTGGLRARDSDRADACGLLDAALADGQLDETEHAARSAAAMRAKTFGELDRLVGDLQVPGRFADAPVVRPARRLPGRRTLLAAVAVGLAAAIGALAGTVGGGGSAAPLPDLTTGNGLRHFVDDYRARFGDTVADEADLFPEHASIDRPSAEPTRSEPYLYRGEFELWGSASTRSRDARSFDLGALNLPVIAQLVAGAPRSLRIPDGDVDHLSLRFEPGDDKLPAAVTIFVQNAAGDSAHMVTGFDGKIRSMYPFEP
ncbi:DUF1707 domain-containing protein [Rhodococcus sp. NPDC059234]|uniref:DUF1707 SHOCT-like domain-containing protein n=1 Tax=Rhodococcus sp. NPDC059234 TaxID=3346781 RepID=UPI00366BFC18